MTDNPGSNPRRRATFPVYEVAIVLVVLGIVASIVGPRMSRGAGAGAAARGEDAVLVGRLKSMRTAIKAYTNDHGGHPVAIAFFADDFARGIDGAPGEEGELWTTAGLSRSREGMRCGSRRWVEADRDQPGGDGGLAGGADEGAPVERRGGRTGAGGRRTGGNRGDGCVR